MRGALHVGRLERIWIALGTITLFAFFIALLTLSLADDINPPSYGRTIDPTKLAQTATIPEEDVNVEILPGWVSAVSHTFQRSGDYLILCNQYCGIGHQAMAARVIVRSETRR